MKVKVLSRNPDEYVRETKLDIHKVQRNYDPSLHPFEAPREYTRALNAVKLDRVFAKPFIGSLDGHRDGIQSLIKHPHRLSTVLSGCCDGEVKVWDLPRQKCVHTLQAHTGFVRGMCITADGNRLLTVGDDKTVKTWEFGDHIINDGQRDKNPEPANTFISKTTLTGITHNFKSDLFATCGDRVDLWESSRAVPLKTFTWGVDTVTSLKFNPIETHLLGSCASDRSIMLYDIRERHPMRRVVLDMRSNTICWNPMEAFVFTAANEDENLYTFDLRNLKKASTVHHGHVGAVIDVDYAPTGREFVTGSYDKTIRIFELDKFNSREIYHTKRMQRLTNVVWSLDNKFVLCASDEMNIRIWKSNASEKLGVLKPREQVSLSYGEKLKAKFAHHPDIKRISRHRHVPRHVFNAKRQKHLIISSQKRREDNRRKNSKPGTVPIVPETVKHVVREDE